MCVCVRVRFLEGSYSNEAQATTQELFCNLFSMASLRVFVNLRPAKFKGVIVGVVVVVAVVAAFLLVYFRIHDQERIVMYPPKI